MMTRCVHQFAFISLMITALVACGPSAEDGRKAARQEYDTQMKIKAEQSAGQTIRPPVPNRKQIPCDQLIDVASYGRALNEVEPMSVENASSPVADAAASCALVRGGTPPTEAQQQKIIKKEGRLGVLAGDDVCVVTAFCWTIQTEQRVKDKCKQNGFELDESLGFPTCVQVVASGVYDVKSFRFYDEDTKCEMWVRGGASQTNNDAIAECAKVARDTITPESIAVTGEAATPATAPPTAAPSATTDPAASTQAPATPNTPSPAPATP
ncbi:MAG: hypothetical protein IPL79_12185 [Myxococcales bacterium]|nr:hypothetical protein [Myxococcales bacterium]